MLKRLGQHVEKILLKEKGVEEEEARDATRSSPSTGAAARDATPRTKQGKSPLRRAFRRMRRWITRGATAPPPRHDSRAAVRGDAEVAEGDGSEETLMAMPDEAGDVRWEESLRFHPVELKMLKQYFRSLCTPRNRSTARTQFSGRVVHRRGAPWRQHPVRERRLVLTREKLGHLFFGRAHEERPLSEDRRCILTLVFNAINTDGDGNVSFKEFARAISTCLHGSFRERAQFSFRLYDANGDGVITCLEMRRYMTALRRMRALRTPLVRKKRGDEEQRHHLGSHRLAEDESVSEVESDGDEDSEGEATATTVLPNTVVDEGDLAAIDCAALSKREHRAETPSAHDTDIGERNGNAQDRTASTTFHTPQTENNSGRSNNSPTSTSSHVSLISAGTADHVLTHSDSGTESDGNGELPGDVTHPYDQSLEVVCVEEHHVPSSDEIDDMIAGFFGDREQVSFDEFLSLSTRINRYMAEGLGIYEQYFLPLVEPIENYLRRPNPYEKRGTLRVNGKKMYHVEIRGGIMYRYDLFDAEKCEHVERISETDVKPRKFLPLDRVCGLNQDTYDPLSFWIVKRRKRNRLTKYTASNLRESREWQFCIVLYLLSTYDNKYGSNYPVREEIEASWFVDGEDYFGALALNLLEAKSQVFICGWCINHQIYLLRSEPFSPRWRLDNLLHEIASKGVHVYIILWKDMELTGMNLMSQRTKHELRLLHPNIHCITHPDKTPFKWTHHQKCVVIDQKSAFLGGLDLSFGRYDTPNHILVDNCHLKLTWPGNDYYNSEFAGYQKQYKPTDAFGDALDRDLCWRQPWHDVQCLVRGALAKDVAANFVSRWNHHLAKKKKKSNDVKRLEKRMPPLAISDRDEENGHRTRKRDKFKKGIKDKLAHIRDGRSAEHEPHTKNPLRSLRHGHRHRRRRNSSSSRSQNVRSHDEDEFRPSRNRNTNGGIYDVTDTVSETQDRPTRFLTGSSDEDASPLHASWHWPAKRRVTGVIEHIAGPLRTLGSRRPYRVNGQVVRSITQWSGASVTERSVHDAYVELISTAKYYIYIENQYFCSSTAGRKIKNRIGQALVDRILRAVADRSAFRVIIVLPQLPDGGIFDNATHQVMKWQNRTIWSTETSVMGQLLQEIPQSVVDQYISFFSLQKYGFLNGRPITNQIYVHSKVMIVDDSTVVIGSANVNDRSMLGSRDSEICVVLNEGQSYTTTYMNGKVARVGKFAKSLRVQLWKEHLGLLYESREDAAATLGDHFVDSGSIAGRETLRRTQKNLTKSPVSWLLEDPISHLTYHGLWRRRATRNTAIYRDVFPTFPNARRHLTLEDYRRDWSAWDDRLSRADEEDMMSIAKKKLDAVKGHVVHYPLYWLEDENFKKEMPLTFLEDEIFF